MRLHSLIINYSKTYSPRRSHVYAHLYIYRILLIYRTLHSLTHHHNTIDLYIIIIRRNILLACCDCWLVAEFWPPAPAVCAMTTSSLELVLPIFIYYYIRLLTVCNVQLGTHVIFIIIKILLGDTVRTNCLQTYLLIRARAGPSQIVCGRVAM